MLKFEKWIPINELDVKTYLAGPQLELLRTWGTDAHNPDPLQKIIQDITTSIRGMASLFAPLPQEVNTIPDQLLLHAVFLVIEALHLRIPTMHLSDNQIRRIQYAQNHMESLIKLHEKQIHLKTKHEAKTSDHSFYGRSRAKRVSSYNLFVF